MEKEIQMDGVTKEEAVFLSEIGKNKTEKFKFKIDWHVVALALSVIALSGQMVYIYMKTTGVV